MSLILKGIDMPKEGEHILALIKNDGKCSYFEETTISRIMKTTEAIPIPTPHGRLIDADEMQDKAYKRYFNNTISSYGMFEVNRAIDNAPTILEAEER